MYWGTVLSSTCLSNRFPKSAVCWSFSMVFLILVLQVSHFSMCSRRLSSLWVFMMNLRYCPSSRMRSGFSQSFMGYGCVGGVLSGGWDCGRMSCV